MVVEDSLKRFHIVRTEAKYIHQVTTSQKGKRRKEPRREKNLKELKETLLQKSSMQLSAGRFETKEINVELFMIIAFQKTNAVSFSLLILCFTTIVRRESEMVHRACCQTVESPNRGSSRLRILMVLRLTLVVVMTLCKK